MDGDEATLRSLALGLNTAGRRVTEADVAAVWAEQREQRREALSEMVRDGLSVAAASRRLGIRQATAWELMQGVPEEDLPAEVIDLRGRRQPRRKPTKSEIAQRRADVAHLVAEGFTSPAIAVKLGLRIPVVERDAALARREMQPRSVPKDEPSAPVIPIARGAPNGAAKLVNSISIAVFELGSLQKFWGGAVPVSHPEAAERAVSEWGQVISGLRFRPVET